MAKKAVLPGCGWSICDGHWGRCENEAKWRSGFSSALCDSCYVRLTHARFPSPGFIQPRFLDLGSAARGKGNDGLQAESLAEFSSAL